MAGACRPRPRDGQEARRGEAELRDRSTASRRHRRRAAHCGSRRRDRRRAARRPSAPAASLEFAFIEDNEELRQAIEDEDFGKWRVFLHPEQREYATRSRNGSFRLSGGAGTGKTVVLLHRAKHLVRTDPSARIVLTTYNKTLASSLLENLRLLDPRLPVADRLGDPGSTSRASTRSRAGCSWAPTRGSGQRGR
ncbi:UvrD-helicase domain-containing protein [Oerskovia sp. M15]